MKVCGKPLFINGRFIAKPITGTERFAREIVFALDKILDETDAAIDVTILAPFKTPCLDNLKRIKFKIVGTTQGHLWEQWDLFWASRNGFLLNFTNSAPVLHRHQLVVIHDALIYRMPQDYSFAYKCVHQTLGRILSKTSKIVTVSDFSRNELSSVLGMAADQVDVVHNGYEHILQHAPDKSVVTRLGLDGKPYFLFVGSPVPRKNLARAIDAFMKVGRPDVSFVIVGAAKAKVFSNEMGKIPSGILMPGRLSDSEIVALYQGATALVFPSLYEGFGIPPLEAMVHGCPVLAARIPPVVEVCGDSVLYFDPMDVSEMTQRMREMLDRVDLRQKCIELGSKRFSRFAWSLSAQSLYEKVIKEAACL